MTWESARLIKYATFGLKVDADIHTRDDNVHAHTLEELVLIANDGYCTFINNGQTLTIQTPAFIWHRAGSYHTFTKLDHPSNIYLASFQKSVFDSTPKSQIYNSFMDNRSLFAISLSSTQAKRMELLFLAHSDSDYYQRQFLLLAIFRQVTLYLEAGAVPIVQNNTCGYILDVAEYIQAHRTERITIDKLAKHFRVSISKLKSDFKNTTTLTIHQFCMEQRMNAAKRLLISTQLTVSQIAQECGFTDESHFIRALRKDTQKTPSAFREMKRNRWVKE